MDREFDYGVLEWETQQTVLNTSPPGLNLKNTVNHLICERWDEVVCNEV